MSQASRAEGQGGPVALLAEAERAWAQGDTTTAEQSLERALAAAPNSVEAKQLLVRVLAESGREQRALEVSNRALAQHPGDHALLVAAACAHELAGDLPRAAVLLSDVVAAEPLHQEANRRLAGVFEGLGDRGSAITCLRRLVEATGGHDLDAEAALGSALSRDGQHGEAIQRLSEVVHRRPEAIPVRADLAMALLAAGQIDEALSGFSEVLRVDPRSAQAHCGLGLAYEQLERWPEATVAFRNTEALAPTSAVGPFNLGLALAAAGDLEEARRALSRAAALAPEDREIQEALQWVAASQETGDPAGPRFGGDLKTFSLPDVLEFLRLQGKTGSLVISSRRGAGIVRLARGRITSATAPGVPRLGEVLVARGIVSQAELARALGLQIGTGPENAEVLGTVLLRERPAEREKLSRVVFEQLLEAVDEMMSWSEGAFAFHPEESADAHAIAFDLQNVMLEVVRISDERKQTAEGAKEDR